MTGQQSLSSQIAHGFEQLGQIELDNDWDLSRIPANELAPALDKKRDSRRDQSWSAKTGYPSG